MDITNADGQTIKLQPTESLVQLNESGLFTTSLIIAEAFDKEHKNVLRDIENLECSEEFNRLNFEPVEYKDAKGEMRPAYRITRDGFSFLAMGFTGKKAAAWKERFLAAFNAMEKALMQAQNIEQKPAKAVQEEDDQTDEQALERFQPRTKIKKEELDAITGFLHMQCYIQKITMDEAISRLSVRMGVFDIHDISHNDYIHCVTSIMMNMFKVDTSYKGEEKKASEEIKEAVNGLINLWVQLSDYKKKDIKNYLCHHCGVYRLEDLQTEEDMLRALFVLWGGLANHSLRRRAL